MKMLLLVGVFALLFVPAALATATTTVTGTASSNRPLSTTFTTNRDGTVSVHATWAPRSGVEYVLRVWSTDAGNSAGCSIGVYSTKGEPAPTPPAGDWTCSFTGVAGHYYADFRPVSGKVSASLAVTAETD